MMGGWRRAVAQAVAGRAVTMVQASVLVAACAPPALTPERNGPAAKPPIVEPTALLPTVDSAAIERAGLLESNRSSERRPTQLPGTDDAFPEVIAVFGPERFRCTGTAVSRRWILTAKHCAPAAAVGVGIDASAMRRVPVRRQRPHPDEYVDAMLLEIVQPLEFIPSTALRMEPTAPQGFLRLVGFGAREADTLGIGIKSFADLIVDDWGCDAARAPKLGCRAHEMVILGTTGGDTCNGDSGGPVFEGEGSEYRMIALTSRALPFPGKACGYGGIYTRVDLIAGWVRETIGEEGRR